MLFTIGTNCSLRIFDIVALYVGDVRNKSHIQIIEKKTGEFEKFPINTKLKPMFDEYTKGKRSDEALFTTIFKNRMDRFGAYYILKKVCKDVGLQEKSELTQCERLLAIIIIKNLKILPCCKRFLIILIRL